MREYKQFVVIPDYLYNCRNLDNDERLILSVVMSYENDNKKLYMSKATFAETYGMSISTVKRKFASFIKDGILIDTGKGLKLDWSELDFRLNIKKILKTKKGGPGRKPKQNHGDTTQNQNEPIKKNHGEPSQNHSDTTDRITVIPRENHGDTQLIKLEKELKKDIKGQETFSFDMFRKEVKEEDELDVFMNTLDI
tara:strand:- start:33 stop:617 length:585 start_codon:yes stop_codon:yes gene_type:complete